MNWKCSYSEKLLAWNRPYNFTRRSTSHAWTFKFKHCKVRDTTLVITVPVDFMTYIIASLSTGGCWLQNLHDDVIKWKHFPLYWPSVWGIHWSPVNSPHKGQWRGTLMFSLIRAWINSCVNNRQAGDLRRHHAHYEVTIMDISHY